MSLADADREALREAVGASGLESAAEGELDGQPLTDLVRPRDAEALAATLRVLSQRGLGAVVRGGGTRSALGNLPSQVDVVLSTTGLGGLREIDLDEGVAQLGGGARVADAEAALAGSGWELPVEPVAPASTIGGALASGAPTLRFGAPRDAVLGLDVVMASGARTRCGGRVVKNVTGYDLAKLQVGALGSLGVIESAWLRLRPRPELVAVWHVPADPGATSLALARKPSVRAALQVAGAGVWIELAGDAPAVERDAAVLAECDGAREASTAELAAAWAPVHAGQTAADGTPEAALCFRVDFLPTRHAGLARAVAAAGGTWRALPARGLGWARFAAAGSGEAASTDAVVSTLARAAAEAAGGWRLEAAPPSAKRGRDVFGALGAAGPIMRALKRQFDPAGVLNPGRIAAAP